MLLGVFCLPVHASLVGTSVTGSLLFSGDPSNYFDPNNGFVPAAGYLNTSGTTVTISNNAVEFGYDDGASQIAADFSGNQLTLSDLIELAGPTNGFTVSFTDAAFAGQYLIPVSDSFTLSGYSLTGDVITLDYPNGNPNQGQDFGATFTIAPIPEPATVWLLSVAVFTILLLRKRANVIS
jgi:hypothetical protein